MTTATTSSAYLTLEEFNSSTTPLSTILVPRSQAIRLVELCQLAEMTPPSADNYFLDVTNAAASASASSNNIGHGGGGSNNGNNGAGEAQQQQQQQQQHRNPHVLVTQMALLLYLGEYTHARHLWRRHRRSSSSSSSSAAALPSESNGAGSSCSSDYDQLEKLWNAAKYAYLWSTGGIHSLTSSSSSSMSDNGSSSSSMMMTMMQVENNENDVGEVSTSSAGGSTNNLPFSTLALRALQSCSPSSSSTTTAATAATDEPLSTYSAELLGVFRSRVNRGLHKSFHKLDCNEFCLRMNLLERADTAEEDDEVWTAYGWRKEEGGGYYLVSNDIDEVLTLDDDAVDGIDGNDGITTMGMKDDRIGKLTEVVMFLEGKVNA